MAIQTIKESELAAVAVASLPSRPNAQPQFGGRGYTAKELKEAFDRLPRLIAERLNALIEEIYSGELAEVLTLPTTGETLVALANDLRADIEGLQASITANREQAVSEHAAVEASLATLLGMRLALDPRTFVLSLLDKDGTLFSEVDLPLESMVVRAAYEQAEKSIVLTLQNGEQLSIEVADLVRGLVNTDALAAALAEKQDVIVYDNEPLAGSQNPVTSDGIRKALMQTKVDTLSETQTMLAPLASKAKIEEELNRLWSALAQTILTEETVEDTYSVRTTADGGEVLDGIPTTLIRITGGTTPTASGVVHSTLNGILSTGANLFPLLSKSSYTVVEDSVTLHMTANPSKSYIAAATGLNKSGDITACLVDGATYVLLQSEYFSGFDAPGCMYWRLIITSHDGTESIRTSYQAPHKFTVNLTKNASYVLQIQTANTKGYTGKRVTFSFAREGMPIVPYQEEQIAWEDTSLGKWDFIDVAKQEVVYATCVESAETPFEQAYLDALGEYVLSEDGMTVAYQGEERREKIEIPMSYLAYYAGREQLLPIGTRATVEQSYYMRAGGVQ